MQFLILKKQFFCLKRARHLKNDRKLTAKPIVDYIDFQNLVLKLVNLYLGEVSMWNWSLMLSSNDQAGHLLVILLVNFNQKMPENDRTTIN